MTIPKLYILSMLGASLFAQSGGGGLAQSGGISQISTSAMGLTASATSNGALISLEPETTSWKPGANDYWFHAGDVYVGNKHYSRYAGSLKLSGGTATEPEYTASGDAETSPDDKIHAEFTFSMSCHVSAKHERNCTVAKLIKWNARVPQP